MRSSKRPYSQFEHAFIRALYRDNPTQEIAAVLGRTPSSVYQVAQRLGLRKSEAYLASAFSGRQNLAMGAARRFPKGHTPWNAGMQGWQAGGRARLTQFKKGQKPWTWQPIGAERVTKDGLLQRKVSDTGYPPRDWKAIHAIVYEQHFGPIPKGHIVVFRDRNRRNFAPANLECISRAENMRRNTYHRYPKEVALAIQLRGALQRQINKREGKHERQHHQRPA